MSSSVITNTVDAIGWNGFMHSDTAVTYPSSATTTNDIDANGDQDPSSADGDTADTADSPFYNWCSLQLCGVAHDVCISLHQAFPLSPSFEQVLLRSPVSRRRPLDPAARPALVNRSTMFLHGLHHASTSRAPVVYMCAIAMTFLFQPDMQDHRMLREFQHRISEFRPILGLSNTVSAGDCQHLVMDYFRLIYYHEPYYHTRFSVLSSYSLWFNEGRAYFLTTEGVRSRLREIMRDSNGAQLRDNYIEYAASGYGTIANQCLQYIRQSQVLHPNDVSVPGCNPNDIALFFVDQDAFYN